MNNHRILIVDDEPEFADFVRRGLSYEGYAVVVTHTASEGLEALGRTRPELVILDLMLPDGDGVDLCRQLRQAGTEVPILMLTARDAVPDRVAGLNAGADDYLVKPFAFEELLARVRALLRRCGEQETLCFADLTLDTALREASRAGRCIRLTAREYELLELFLRRPQQVLKRAEIIEQVWGYDFEGESNVLDVYVRRLRRKLGRPSLIQTVHGVGYVLREGDES